MKGRCSYTFIVKFGLLNIGMKAYNVAVQENIEFKRINPTTNNTIVQELLDSITKKQITQSECSLGFDYEGQTVTFTNEELKLIQGSKLSTIELSDFVDVSEVNPLIIEKFYFLTPDKAMDRQYKLLQHALENSNKAAIGYWYTDRKDKLVAIYSVSGKLVICFLYYQNELREFDPELKTTIALSEEEKQGAEKLVEAMSSKFKHDEYGDCFTMRVASAARKKIKAQTPKPKQPQAPIITLQTEVNSSLKYITDQLSSIKKA